MDRRFQTRRGFQRVQVTDGLADVLCARWRWPPHSSDAPPRPARARAASDTHGIGANRVRPQHHLRPRAQGAPRIVTGRGDRACVAIRNTSAMPSSAAALLVVDRDGLVPSITAVATTGMAASRITGDAAANTAASHRVRRALGTLGARPAHQLGVRRTTARRATRERALTSGRRSTSSPSRAMASSARRASPRGP
jgi:hypothetical protein